MTDKTSISARTIAALNAIAKAGHDIADALRETGRAEDAQIAASVPAERPRADSAGRGTSGGLGERLRTLRQRFIGNAGEDNPNNDQDLTITGYTFWAVVQGLEAMADEADRLTEARNLHRADANSLLQQKDQWRDSANVAEAEATRLRTGLLRAIGWAEAKERVAKRESPEVLERAWAMTARLLRTYLEPESDDTKDAP